MSDFRNPTTPYGIVMGTGRPFCMIEVRGNKGNVCGKSTVTLNPHRCREHIPDPETKSKEECLMSKIVQDECDKCLEYGPIHETYSKLVLCDKCHDESIKFCNHEGETKQISNYVLFCHDCGQEIDLDEYGGRA